MYQSNRYQASIVYHLCFSIRILLKFVLAICHRNQVFSDLSMKHISIGSKCYEQWWIQSDNFGGVHAEGAHNFLILHKNNM